MNRSLSGGAVGGTGVDRAVGLLVATGEPDGVGLAMGAPPTLDLESRPSSAIPIAPTAMTTTAATANFVYWFMGEYLHGDQIGRRA